MSHREALFAHMIKRPDAIAFEIDDGGEHITFGELYLRAQSYAAGLQETFGILPGDRVLCRMDTSIEMIVALVGHYLLGAIHVPVNTRYGAMELAHIVEDSDPAVIIVGDDHSLELLGDVLKEGAPPPSLKGILTDEACDMKRALRVARVETFAALKGRASDLAAWPDVTSYEVGDEHTALMLYTSGTTGKSKGVELSYRAIVSGIGALTSKWRFTPEDRLVLALPLFHVHGLGIGVHGTLLRGNRALLQPRFSPGEVARALDEWRGTIFMGVPTMYARLVRYLDEHEGAADAFASARLYTSGSAALSSDLFERFEAHTGHRILERYGMSETLLTISNPYEPSARRPGTIGSPIALCEAAILTDDGQVVDVAHEPRAHTTPTEGELLVRGESLMSGYWRNEQATREAKTPDGWFKTGDAVRLDEHGCLVHMGRQSVDILKVGGYKISAREIEETILAHAPGVLECAVFGKPDEEWGEVIIAAVVVEDAEAAPAATIRAMLKGKIADYKLPREVIAVPEIPRNALGKVQKHKLRSMI